MVEFFTFTEASRGPPKASWRSGLWTAVRRLSTPGLLDTGFGYPARKIRPEPDIFRVGY